MTQINSYLTFNGNCRDAMLFYKGCFGGELVMQTIGESPMADGMPADMKGYILHSSLTNGNIVMMGTDCVPEQGLVKGNAVSLCINCSSEKEIKEYYKKLAQGGKKTYPLENTHWGALFGGLIDKYGNHWLLNFQNEATPEKSLHIE